MIRFIANKIRFLFIKREYSPSEWGECSGVFTNCNPGEHSLNIPFDKIHLYDPNCKLK